MADTTSPALVALTPAHHASNVPVDSSIVLSFDEPVVRGSGALFVFDVFGNQLFDMDLGIGVTTSVTGSQVTIDPTLNLPGNAHIVVGSNAGIAVDADGNKSFPLPVYDFDTGSDPLDLYHYGTTGDDLFTPTASHQIFVGGPGLDTVFLGSTLAANTVTHSHDRFTIADTVAGTSFDALNIDRIHFSDSKLALDLDGQAGWVAEILGAVFGDSALTNATYVGIGLVLADAGSSFEDLVRYALQARFGPDPDASVLVQALYTDVVGTAPSSADLSYFVALLDSHAITPVGLGVLAALHPANLDHIDLVGLMQTGLVYGP
jgi:hypothetical protein